MSKNPIIVFEGIEGSGKSYHINKVSKYLKKQKLKFIKIREPGGNINSEKIRKLILDKKSKLRNYFEKKSDCICTAFYPDTPDTLIKLASNFMKINNLSLSRENMNLIVRKSNGDRSHLKVELEKIKLFSKDKKITNSQLFQQNCS